jgi:hypothetical protein
MKTLIVLVMTTAAVGGAMGLTTAPNWAASFDARPEALIVGASMLLVASLIRQRVSQNRIKQ